MAACSPAADPAPERASLAGVLASVVVGHAAGVATFPWVRPVLDWWFA